VTSIEGSILPVFFVAGVLAGAATSI